MRTSSYAHVMKLTGYEGSYSYNKLFVGVNCMTHIHCRTDYVHCRLDDVLYISFSALMLYILFLMNNLLALLGILYFFLYSKFPIAFVLKMGLKCIFKGS